MQFRAYFEIEVPDGTCSQREGDRQRLKNLVDLVWPQVHIAQIDVAFELDNIV